MEVTQHLLWERSWAWGAREIWKVLPSGMKDAALVLCFSCLHRSHLPPVRAGAARCPAEQAASLSFPVGPGPGLSCLKLCQTHSPSPPITHPFAPHHTPAPPHTPLRPPSHTPLPPITHLPDFRADPEMSKAVPALPCHAQCRGRRPSHCPKGNNPHTCP